MCMCLRIFWKTKFNLKQKLSYIQRFNFKYTLGAKPKFRQEIFPYLHSI